MATGMKNFQNNSLGIHFSLFKGGTCLGLARGEDICPDGLGHIYEKPRIRHGRGGGQKLFEQCQIDGAIILKVLPALVSYKCLSFS